LKLTISAIMSHTAYRMMTSCHNPPFTWVVGRTFRRQLCSLTGHRIVKDECPFIGHCGHSRSIKFVGRKWPLSRKSNAPCRPSSASGTSPVATAVPEAKRSFALTRRRESGPMHWGRQANQGYGTCWTSLERSSGSP
jgi:hypothetical protein